MNIFPYVLIVIAAIMLAACIRIVPETERIIVYNLGRFAGLKGPGLLLKILGLEQWQRVKLGDSGEMTGPDRVRIANVDVPAIADSRLRLGAKVTITGFEKAAVRVDLDPELSRHVICPKCLHEFEA